MSLPQPPMSDDRLEAPEQEHQGNAEDGKTCTDCRECGYCFGNMDDLFIPHCDGCGEPTCEDHLNHKREDNVDLCDACNVGEDDDL